jgi:pimeloyl-ACP methyl ester carboxylesterase
MHAMMWLLMALVSAHPLQTESAQVAPAYREAGQFRRSADRHRAVVLIHGFKPHPFSDKEVFKAECHSWQRTGCELVTALGRHADVYRFAYGQNATVSQIAKSEGLADLVRWLKALEYREIVLVGHSTGGIVAREFVEDNPQAGVTKVVQVCAPNAGTAIARANFGVRKSQEVLLESLTREAREKALRERADRTIPAHIEFVCVVCQLTVDVEFKEAVRVGRLEFELNGSAGINGDGVVATNSQWSEDLQKQGIPAVVLPVWHNAVMRCPSGVEKIAELVREKQPRWSAEKVAEQKPVILNGKK